MVELVDPSARELQSWLEDCDIVKYEIVHVGKAEWVTFTLTV